MFVKLVAFSFAVLLNLIIISEPRFHNATKAFLCFATSCGIMFATKEER